MQQQTSPHSQVKRRTCPYCFKEFAKNDHYSRHLRSHTKEKPFRCNICGHHYPRRDTLLRHVKIHERESDPRRWRHAFANDHGVQGSHQRHSHSNGTNPASLPNVSEEVGLVDTTTSLHIHRALSGTTFNLKTGTDLPASSPIRGSQEGSNQVISEIDVGNINVDIRSLAGSMYSEPTVALGTVGQNPDLGVFNQSHQSSSCSPLTIASGLCDIDYSLDTSDWLLENELFELFDFKNLQSGSLDGQVASDSDASPCVRDLRDVWYVPVAKMDCDLGTNATAISSKQAIDLRGDIDEAYRADMATTLLRPVRNEPLPSIDLLNVCIRLFFTRINVMLPLVHGPTFRPTPNNTLLVLSICSAGTLTMDSGNAAKVGCMLFERVNKSGMTLPWERIVSRQPEMARSNLKVAAIGQIFALLSGEPAHRMIGNSFHGGMIASARHLKLFDDTPPLELPDDLSPRDLDKAWRAWASEEEMKRYAIILYIQDAELAALFHQEPNFRHNTRPLPTACSAELFTAPTAAAWAAKYRAMRKRKEGQTNLPSEHMDADTDSERPVQIDHRHQPDMLNAYAILSGVGASVCEFRRLGLLSSDLNRKLGADLVQWYASARISFHASEECGTLSDLPVSLRILWHYTFISLTVDLNTLEVAVGREGPNNIVPDLHEYVRSWISSLNSKRSLFHALYLQNLVTSTNLGSSSAIHTARILFSAALCWYCYILYLPSMTVATDMAVVDSNPDELLEYLAQLPESRLLCTESRSSPASTLWHKTMTEFPKILGATPTEMKENTLCVIESALRGLGTCGISRRFADIIYIFISGEMNG
ncbi:uncharacterized protein PV07_01498 [Cladophialophora immunda]|uniref:C2H2-type domain-containing protein n=1 Tax=Cladophialophora immunda TaxID=569365 RepID=A0A0D2CXU8_9EURO|nr:uncharacterized protein PV07_01498 [Cladophialophora immunda]KIW34740.1 hypothetical protein PV07_01498 [Cladophialophora immunda]